MDDENRLRAAAIAGVLHHVAELPTPATGAAIFYAVMKDLGLPEERCGVEINAAIFVLLRSGLIVSDAFDVSTESFVNSADLVLKGSPMLTNFVWA